MVKKELSEEDIQIIRDIKVDTEQLKKKIENIISSISNQPLMNLRQVRNSMKEVSENLDHVLYYKC